MTDNHLCFLAAMIIAAYGIYMAFEGGDGIIFGSVLASITALSGLYVGRRYAQPVVRVETEPIEDMQP